MVSVEIISQEDDMMTVLFKDSDRALLNAVRRNLMGHIPKMAIDTVRFQMGTYDQCIKCEHLNPAGVARRTAGGTDARNVMPLSKRKVKTTSYGKPTTPYPMR